jgi:hypothetical protein
MAAPVRANPDSKATHMYNNSPMRAVGGSNLEMPDGSSNAVKYLSLGLKKPGGRYLYSVEALATLGGRQAHICESDGY